jgi:8-oxo-dGTP pyrophosphatase MutT (NUDIX family)
MTVTWPPDCYQRATAYLTDPGGRLLVFDHLDAPRAGTQVPAGGILAGEDPADAVVRELEEESGVVGARLVRKLGEAWRRADVGNVPAGLEEQVHHAFHLHLDAPTPEDSWDWDECSGGHIVEHRFRLRWVTLEDAAVQLFPVQAMWLESLRCSLADAANLSDGGQRPLR